MSCRYMGNFIKVNDGENLKEKELSDSERLVHNTGVLRRARGDQGAHMKD